MTSASPGNRKFSAGSGLRALRLTFATAVALVTLSPALSQSADTAPASVSLQPLTSAPTSTAGRAAARTVAPTVRTTDDRPDPTNQIYEEIVQSLDRPTQFQVLVQQTLGSPLPIFGADLFRLAPATFSPVNSGQVTPDYIIGPGDELQIVTTGQFASQDTFVVDRAGAITVPDVGPITVSGVRFEDLRGRLRERYGRIYRNFDLTVTIGQQRAIQIYVLGEARRPGSYTVSSSTTAVNAIFAAGGVRPQGSLRHIQIRRGATTVSDIDLYDLLLRGDKSKDVTLQPGDIVFIPAVGPQIAIAGAVTEPAIYELRGPSTVQNAIDLANGLTSIARSSSIRVDRILNGAQRGVEDVNLGTNPSFPVRGGDIISIEAISDQYKDAVTLRGNVLRPGRYVWHAGIRLSDVIPNRESLIPRSYFLRRNTLGQAPRDYISTEEKDELNNPDLRRQRRQQILQDLAGAPAQTGAYGPNGGYYPRGAYAANGTFYPNGLGNSTGSSSAAGTMANGNEGVLPAQGTSAQNVTSASASGTRQTAPLSAGEALTQGNSTFTATNDIVLSAPDVNLAYAVIERLDPVTLTTSLIPFHPGALLNGNADENLLLQPGDVITIFSTADLRVPQSQQTRFVRLEGEFIGAGLYSVLPGETLRSLVRRAGGFSKDAYLYASEFTRQSTRRLEQQRLREYADSLEAQINAQTAASSDPNSIAASAAAARESVALLRRKQSTGRIVLGLVPTSVGIESVPEIPLEDGDRFIVPGQPTSVSVGGQVYNATSFLYTPDQRVKQYLQKAGGPDRNSDRKRIFVIRADGSVLSRQYGNVYSTRSLPGDTVVVPPKYATRNILRDIASVATVLSQFAIGVAVIAALKN